MTLRARHAAVLTILGCLIAAAPASAARELTFIRGGNVYIANADGSSQKRITRGGGFQSPSMADDGTVVALRRRRDGNKVVRIRQSGRLIGRPAALAGGGSDMHVSPNGRTVAYEDSRRTTLCTFSCPVRTFLMYERSNGSSRGVDRSPGVFSDPSWPSNRTVIMTAGVDVYADPAGRGGRYPLNAVIGGQVVSDAEASRDLRWLMWVGSKFYGDGAFGRNGVLALLSMRGLRGSKSLACSIKGVPGGFRDPTFSSDGRYVAWADNGGIRRMTLSQFRSCSFNGLPRVVVRRASQPDFGLSRSRIRR
jgi:hypothetical protein